MKYLSLFSGIEAASEAWSPLGWTCVGVSEIEAFPNAVLMARQSGVPNLGDITKISEADVRALGRIDLVVFGSPCQDLSVAGKRKGFVDAEGDTTRSGLFFAAMRIVGWARKHSRLRFALWENVPGAFSSNGGADFGAVVSALAGLADSTVPPKGWGTEGCILGTEAMVEWSVLDAQWFGVAQRRRRVFALADFGDWAGRPPLLLEPEGMRGDSAPRREAGQSTAHAVAPCLTSSGRGVERTGDPRGQDAVVDDKYAVGLPRPILTRPVICVATGQAGAEITRDHAPTLNCNHEVPYVTFAMGSQPCEFCGYLFDQELLGKYGCPNCEGEGSPDYENSGGQPDVVYPINDMATRFAGTDGSGHQNGKGHGLGIGAPEDPMFTLTKGDQHIVAYGFQSRIGRNGRGDMGDVVNALNAQSGETGKGDAAPCVAIGFDSRQDCVSSTDVFGALGSSSPQAQAVAMTPPMQVRRLTPTECERLQGFRDLYTQVPYRNKPAADGPRYKALGNSMAVPVMSWIGRQIDFAMLFDTTPTFSEDLFL